MEEVTIMRLVFKKYADGGHSLVRTADDGSNPEIIDGDIPKAAHVRRVPIFFEVSCDDRADAVEETQVWLKRVSEQMKGFVN